MKFVDLEEFERNFKNNTTIDFIKKTTPAFEHLVVPAVFEGCETLGI